jgi:drug/metabolite transporter (DMT)-like permease
MLNYIVLAVFTLLLVTGQIFFKYAALSLRNEPIGGAVATLASTPTFYVAVTIYGGATLMWVWVLSRVPLSQAYPWVALATAAVPAIAVLVFHERLHSVYWLGVVLVVLGVFLTQRAAQSP